MTFPISGKMEREPVTAGQRTRRRIERKGGLVGHCQRTSRTGISVFPRPTHHSAAPCPEGHRCEGSWQGGLCAQVSRLAMAALPQAHPHRALIPLASIALAEPSRVELARW